MNYINDIRSFKTIFLHENYCGIKQNFQRRFHTFCISTPYYICQCLPTFIAMDMIYSGAISTALWYSQNCNKPKQFGNGTRMRHTLHGDTRKIPKRQPFTNNPFLRLG